MMSDIYGNQTYLYSDFEKKPERREYMIFSKTFDSTQRKDTGR